MYPELWYLPCSDTPFLNRNHPVFLAIKDRVVDVDEGQIRLRHFGWVSPFACCKQLWDAELQLFHHYETLWIDRGLTKVKPCTLFDFCNHRGLPKQNLPWFDLHRILSDDYDLKDTVEEANAMRNATINVEAFMRP
jgi:hypothetical protein